MSNVLDPCVLRRFSGPPTHIDKYLVERFFDGGVGTPLIFTALVGVPGIR